MEHSKGYKHWKTFELRRSCTPQRWKQKVQLGGITREMQDAISGNLLAEYRKYIDEDNPEETDL